MRLDKYLTERFGSRNKAATAVKNGLVLVNGKPVFPSYEVKEGDSVDILPDDAYVSVGGYKLEKALEDFGFSVAGGVFADVGASTGGFTDCLFKNGAKKVYCIDVGESQLDKSLFTKNVVVIDNFNARNLRRDLFEEELDGVVIDVSFISLTYILEAVASVVGEGKSVLALIKPQFECESKSVGKNGIVREPARRKKILEKIYNFAKNCNLAPVQLTCAPLHKNKNVEYIMRFIKGGEAQLYANLVKSIDY